MSITASVVGALAVAAATTAPAPAPNPPVTGPDVEVLIERQNDGGWVADFKFHRAAPAWAFRRSAVIEGARTPWRPSAWTVETPGVRLERRGDLDVLIGAGPLDRVRVRFEPRAEGLEGDYEPALLFSDGGVAHFTGHFQLGALAGLAKASPDRGDLIQTETALTFSAPGARIWMQGEEHRAAASVPLGTETYVFVGDTPVQQTPAVTVLLDAGLPGWFQEELHAYLPRLLSLYQEKLGQPVGGRPTVLAAWRGADGRDNLLRGSVLPALMILEVGGPRLAAPNLHMRDRVRWYLAHETAHFWAGQTVRYENAGQTWILEGAADLLAVRAIEELAPDFDPRSRLQTNLDDCLALIGPAESLNSAQARGDFRAHYGCGAALLLAAEAGLRQNDPQADAFTFWRRLIENNRTGVISQDAWLSEFELAVGTPELTGRIREFLDHGVAAPADLFIALFVATGVTHRLAGDRLELE